MPGATGGANITAAAQIADDIITSNHILNGEIVNADISASAAIAYSKLNLANSIVNADIAAAAAIVDTKLAAISTAGKVDGAALTGLANIPAGAGVIPSANVPAGAQHWEELADVNLASAAASLASGTIAARAFLRILILIPSFSADDNPGLRFNGDTGANYNRRYAINDGADATASSETQLNLSPDIAGPVMFAVDIANRGATRKVAIAFGAQGAAAASAPGRRTMTGTWDNSTNQITSITLLTGDGATMAAGTRMIVYGSDT